MAGIVRKRPGRRNREPRTIPVIQTSRLLGQMHPPVLSDLDAWRDHDFPGMAVGVGEIAGITAVVGLMRRFQQRRALADREGQNRIDLVARGAVPGERDAAEGRGPRIVR